MSESEYTPSTEEVRDAFIHYEAFPDFRSADFAAAEAKWLRWLLAERARIWDEGYEAGDDQAFFDLRGLPSDSDAHTFPRVNPYRKGGDA